MGNVFEIRFHGRGGQGAVMAAQTLADAAVREGYHAQAFPYFGAERRGAPVQAFARIDKKKIRLKSQVYAPDLLVVLDASLFEMEPVTAGLRRGGRIAVNTPLRPEELDIGKGSEAITATADATSIALDSLKMPIVNTAMLGVLCRVQDLVTIEAVMEAIQERFGEKLGALAGRVNAQVAWRAYDNATVGLASGKRELAETRQWLPSWDEIPIGTSLRAGSFDGVEVGPGSARQNLTGWWRWATPRYKKDKCIRCLRCWWSCPDAAIIRLDDDYMRWDFDYCKGCGICAEICPVDAIDMIRGVHRWE